MMRFLACIATISLAGFLFTTACSAAEPQQKECFKGEQYADLWAILDAWNKGDLRLQKETFKEDFQLDIRDIAESEKKPKEWMEYRLKTWGLLKSALSSEKKLSNNAEMMLLSLYGENATLFLQQYKERSDREYRLKLKLYFILSLAQDYASKSDSKEIEPSHIFAAVQEGFTGLWPFCPKRPPN